MKKVFLPLLLLPFCVAGQATFGHLDSIELAKMQQAQPMTESGVPADGPLTLLMRVADDATVGRVEAAGAVVEQREGPILIVTAPLSKVQAVAAVEGVVTVSLSREMTVNAVNPMGDDLSRSTLGLDKIQGAASPLPTAYTGAGVVVGLVDMGIDVHHAAFLNPDGTHRVKRAWKHIVSGKNTLTITADTEEKIVKFKSDAPSTTHGTHTMGLAAGSFHPEGGPDFRGAAPDADIAVSCGYTDNARIIKGVRSIVDYAKSENKPCVVNISLGTNTGPHDGTDELPAALNQIATDENVSIFVSCGNEGAYQAFLYKEFSADDKVLKTFVAPSNYTAALYPGISLFPQALGSLDVWSDDGTPFTVHIDMIRFIDNKPTVVSTFTLPASGSAYLANNGSLGFTPDMVKTDDADFNTVYRSSFIGGAGSVYAANGRYHTELNFQLECTSAELFQQHFMSLRIEGEPGHKIYAYGTPMSGVFAFSLLGGGFEGFTTSDGNGSLNALAGADKLVTVGSYITHNFVPVATFGRETVGTTASYSSWGLTPDGRIHPIVSAPGSRIVSSMSSEYVASYDYSEEIQPIYYTHTAADGTKHYFTPMTGTSMSSPYMAGVAAVWLSADPTLTTEQIVAIARETASAPSVPRVNDGTGAHLDAFKGLCKVLNLSGVADVNVADKPIAVSGSGNVFTVSAAAARSLSAQVVNTVGAVVAQASGATEELAVDCSALPAGVYILNISADNTSAAQKILVK